MIDILDSEAPPSFTSYEDIAKRPRFKTEVDISITQIDKLITDYRFPEKHPCGKKGCHQPHNNGWLAVTTDNQECLIGSRCGKEWGGDSFILQRNQLSKRQARNSQLTLISKTLQNAETIFDRIHEIKNRSKGATWLDKTIKKLEENCTQEIMQVIKSRARRGESAVENSRLKTQEERDSDDASQAGSSSSAYKTEVIGQLVGLEVFNSDLREVLMDDIYSKLKTLQKLEPSALTTPALNKLTKEINEFELLFNKAEEILNYGKLFFSTATNFKLIKFLDKQGKHSHLSKVNWHTDN